MSKIDRLDYLEDERKKLWQAIVELDGKIDKKTPEYENEAKQSSKKASEFRNRSEESRNTILQYQHDSKDIFDSICAVRDEINNLRGEIAANSEFVTSSVDSTAKIVSDIENKNNAIQYNISELDESFSNLQSHLEKIKKLDDIVAKSEELLTKIDTIHKNALVKRKEIDEVYFEIIGYTETDANGEETAVPGLKDELEDAYNELKLNLDSTEKELANYKNSTINDYSSYKKLKEDEYAELIDKWKTDYITIVKRIDDLLPKALTTGLSYAYSEKKDSEANEAVALAKKFQTAINWSL
jgi:uncharacterized coiled-coil DUF342 family protein